MTDRLTTSADLWPTGSRHLRPDLETRAAGIAAPVIPQFQQNKPQWATRTTESYAQLRAISTTLFACLSYRANAVASATVRVYRTADNEPQPKSPLRLLLQNPNDEQSEAEFLSFIQTVADVAGFAPVQKVRSGPGRVVQLWPLRPDWCRPIPRPQASPDWEYRVPGYEPLTIAAEDMLVYTPTASLDRSATGMSAVSVALRQLSVERAMDDFLVSLFQRGALPLVALTFNDGVAKPDPDEARAMREQFSGQYGGVDNWNKVALLGDVKSIERIGYNLNELAYNDLRGVTEVAICCLPETQILTKRGVVLIPDVVVGDEVLTHRGRWRTVTGTEINPVGDRPVVEVQAKGFDPLRLTADHPVYAARFNQNRSHQADVIRFDWVAAGALRAKRSRGHFDSVTLPMLAPVFPGDGQPVRRPAQHMASNRIARRERDGLLVAASPRTKAIPASLPLTPALGRLLGYYLAEGSCGPHAVNWYFATEEIAYQDQVVADLHSTFGLSARRVERGSVTAIVADSSLLARMLGRGTAHTKRVPEWAWAGDREFHGAMLQAWADGDGSEDRHAVRIQTSSKHLAWGMRTIAVSLGLPASIRRAVTTGRVIAGRPIKDGKTYLVCWRKNRERTGSYRIDGHHLTSAVRSVEPVAYDGLVYNLHVEDDHSYLTTGGMVHNCQAFGIPPILIGAKVGLDKATYSNYGQARQSFYEDTVTPLWARIDGCFTRSLVGEFGDAGVGLEFDTSDVPALKADEDKLWSRATAGIRGGYIMVNDARRLVGYEDVVGGDVFLRPADPLAGDPGAVIRALPGQPRAITATAFEVRTVGGIERRYLPVTEQRATTAETSRKRARRLADRFTPKLAAFWQEQGERVAAALPAQRSVRIETTTGQVIEALTDLKKRDIAEPLIGWDDEAEALRLLIGGFHGDVSEAAFDAALEALGVAGGDISFDLANPNIANVLEQLGLRITDIAETTRTDVQRVVGEALDNGETVDDLANRLRTLFEKTYAGRAETVARTESQVAYSLGSQRGYIDSGIVPTVQMLDGKECESGAGGDGLRCPDRNGMVIPVEDMGKHSFGTHPRCQLAFAPIADGAEEAP